MARLSFSGSCLIQLSMTTFHLRVLAVWLDRSEHLGDCLQLKMYLLARGIHICRDDFGLAMCEYGLEADALFTVFHEPRASDSPLQL